MEIALLIAGIACTGLGLRGIFHSRADRRHVTTILTGLACGMTGLAISEGRWLYGVALCFVVLGLVVETVGRRTPRTIGRTSG